MIATGWRTVIAEKPEQLDLRDGRIVMTRDEDVRSVPVQQVRELMISGGTGMISLSMLNQLLDQHTAVVLCDSHHRPSAELLGYNLHNEAAGHLMDQASWTDRRKQAVWRQLVRMKLQRQEELLSHLGRKIPEGMHRLPGEVTGDDATNREAVVARLYFRALFGKEFRRHADDRTNAALNYGYAIIQSAVSRCIALHGYSTALGIHHCSRDNRFNLACDIMEPFRPFVDRIVAPDPGRGLDWPYMQELIAVLHQDCLWNSQRTSVAEAIDALTLEVLTAMQTPRYRLKEVSLG